MTTRLLIGQALVTDPSVEAAGGYQLVAASPSVPLEDREQLEATPQISDFLHLEDPPGSYVSFYQLPSGLWAFGRRFARGKRRRETFNRIVTWTLVLPESLLEALAWEPWLLPTCRFQRTGEGAFFSYKQLTEQEPGLAAVDLAAELPANAEAQRLAFLEPRVQFLRDRWGKPALEGALGQALSVFENGGRLLLPQGAEHEQLAALAWSALPRRDRRSIAWTTHLAPGSGELFRLANVPAPEEARHGLGGDREWALLGEAAVRAGALALVRSLVEGKPPFARVAQGWYEANGSLAANGERVRRWVMHVQAGAAPADGFSSVAALAKYLDAHANDATAATDPWRGPGELLRLCAMTVRNLVWARQPRERSAADVFRLIDERGLAPATLAPELLYELATVERDGEVVLAALAMALRHTRHAAPTAAVLLAATEPLERRGDRSLLGHVAEQFVVPALGGSPPPPLASVLRDHLDLFLYALRSVPAGLAAALRDWKDDLFDRVVQELGDLLASDRDAVRQVAREVAAHDAELPPRASVQGLSGRLEAVGVPLENRFPFLLAEAAYIDHEGLPADVDELRASLARLDSEKRRTLARRLCRQLPRAPKLGAAHRALTSQLAAALALCPEEAVAALALDRDNLSATEFLAWHEVICEVAQACQDKGHRPQASALRANWCLQGKRWSGPEIVRKVYALLPGLLEGDAVRVANAWAPRRAFPSFRHISDLARLRAFVIGLQLKDGSPLEDEIAQLGAEAREGTLPWKELADVCDEILPHDSVERLKTLLGLLLCPRLFPSTRLQLRGLLAKAVANAGPRIFQALPSERRVAWLTRDGALLLNIAEALGERWTEAPYDCWDFLREALRLARFDAVAALLRGTDRLAGRSFLTTLAGPEGQPELVPALVRAARHEVHRWDFAGFRTRLTQLNQGAQ